MISEEFVVYVIRKHHIPVASVNMRKIWRAWGYIM